MQLANKWVLIAITLCVMLGVVAGGVALAQTPLVISLTEQNGSGESGTATFTETSNGTVRVEVVINNAPAGVSQPLHVHEGTCANLNPAPKFPLTNLENGTSTTEITTTLEALLASPHAVNGHKSAAEASVYVFCGDIVEAAMQVTGTVTATTAATTAATVEATTTSAAEATTTPSAETTPATTLPATGTESPFNGLVLVVVFGAIVLLLGLYARRIAR